jgi:DNA-binding helix-hairpin-helix protein with protein kinase domain
MMLHSRGHCYRDISFGNVFFDPSNGDVLICDVDNVSINEESPKGVLGTPYFMAPEIVRGEAFPSTRTDLFSLAVLLFHVFMVDHPLEGRRARSYASWGAVAMDDLFGAHPVFIFDPEDRSNEAVPEHNDNALRLWPLYPDFLRRLFIQAFTEGLRDPANGRVQESVWRAAMVRLRDSVVYCACGKQNLFDEHAPQLACWSCRRSVKVPPKLRIGRHLIVLNHDTRVFAHHLRNDYDFTTAVAEISQHPEHPELWGLRNVSTEPWRSMSSDGAEVIEFGHSLRLQSNLRVDFGAVEGEIVP